LIEVYCSKKYNACSSAEWVKSLLKLSFKQIEVEVSGVTPQNGVG
jgi:hypothetical protein